MNIVLFIVYINEFCSFSMLLEPYKPTGVTYDLILENALNTITNS